MRYIRNKGNKCLDMIHEQILMLALRGREKSGRIEEERAA
jgi:hypothetical protein